MPSFHSTPCHTGLRQDAVCPLSLVNELGLAVLALVQGTVGSFLPDGGNHMRQSRAIFLPLPLSLPSLSNVFLRVAPFDTL